MKFLIVFWFCIAFNSVYCQRMLSGGGSSGRCEYAGKTYMDGEEFTNNNIRHKCGKGGMMQTIGCEADNGLSMMPGDKYSTSTQKHECIQEADGSIRYAYHGGTGMKSGKTQMMPILGPFSGMNFPSGSGATQTSSPFTAGRPLSPNRELGDSSSSSSSSRFGPGGGAGKKCEKNGKTYNAGEEWTGNNFRYRCNLMGSTELIGCITDDGHEMVPGETHTAGRMVHECKGTAGGRLGYEWQMCRADGCKGQ